MATAIICAYATLRSESGNVIATFPLSDVEMAIYRCNPDTVFDVVKPIGKSLTKPLEWFDFFAQPYMSAKTEPLLEWMKDHPDIATLRTK